MILNYDDTASLNELFGIFKIDSNNKIVKISKGKLFSVDEKNFIVYVQNPDKVIIIIIIVKFNY